MTLKLTVPDFDELIMKRDYTGARTLLEVRKNELLDRLDDFNFLVLLEHSTVIPEMTCFRNNGGHFVTFTWEIIRRH